MISQNLVSLSLFDQTFYCYDVTKEENKKNLEKWGVGVGRKIILDVMREYWKENLFFVICEKFW